MKCDRCGKDNPAEVHTCFPLALKLADLLDLLWLDGQTPRKAAAELRRLYEENVRLESELERVAPGYAALARAGEVK